jgi:hypothetical protein
VGRVLCIQIRQGMAALLPESRGMHGSRQGSVAWISGSS